MVGYCISTLADNGQGEVDSIYVTAVVRGRGIGKQLMQDAMAWLRERGAHPIVVEVMAGNVAAEKLYESFGFSARTVRMRYVGEEP
jgi:ribosomal-protein-alanine N-acetyltransferase